MVGDEADMDGVRDYYRDSYNVLFLVHHGKSRQLLTGYLGDAGTVHGRGYWDPLSHLSVLGDHDYD